MARIIKALGRVFNLPDETTDDQVSSFLMERATEQGAKVDATTHAQPQRMVRGNDNRFRPEGTQSSAFEEPVEALYRGITRAETRGEDDPFIRTRITTAKGGSTAYGPAQITAKLAREFRGRHSNLFTPEENDYLDRFISQGELFIKFGNEPQREGYDKRYDYGGGGDLTSEEDRAVYPGVAKKMLNFYHKKFEGNRDKVLDAWRFGESSKKTVKKDDPRYFGEVERGSAPVA
jgi:hypothetical protein